MLARTCEIAGQGTLGFIYNSLGFVSVGLGISDLLHVVEVFNWT